MFLKIMLLLIVIFSIAIREVLSASVSPTWITTSLIQSGTKTIVSSSSYQNNPKEGPYIFTYSPAFSSSPFTALGLISAESQAPTINDVAFLINIDDYMNTNLMKIKMVYATNGLWRTFKVSYIAIDPSMTYMKTDYFAQANPLNVSFASGDRQLLGTQSLANPVDSTHDISIIPLLVGLNISSADATYQLEWVTSLVNNTHISYSLKVKGWTRITNIVSYILVYDKTTGQNAQQIFLDQIYITGSSNTANSVSLVFSDPSNFQVGLNSMDLTQFGFNFDKQTLILTGLNYISLNFSAWNFRQRTCPALTPYYQLNSNLCYDQCPVGYTEKDGQNKKYCPHCNNFLDKCTSCSSQTQCLTCQHPFTIQVSTNTCICASGYYLNSNLDCFVCHSNCKTCIQTATKCLSCDQVIRTYDAGTNSCNCMYGVRADGSCKNNCTFGCLQCPDNTDICQKCEISFQLLSSRCSCYDRFYLNTATQTCQSCHSSCYLCTGPIDNQCVECDFDNDHRVFDSGTNKCNCDSIYEQNATGYCVKSKNAICTEGFEKNLTSLYCEQICGDGKVVELQCDDGNLQNGDGCDSNCKVQLHYICLPGSLTQKSLCSYEGTITFELSKAKKDPFANRMQLQYNIIPVIKLFSQYNDMTLYFSYSNPFVKIESANFDSSSGKMLINIQYQASIQSQSLLLSFVPPASPTSFAIQNSSANWVVQSDNNLAVLKYSDDTYFRLQIFYYVGLVSYIIAMVIFVGTLFFRKYIGLQLISAFQISYLSFTYLNFAKPFFGILLTWNFVSGYNGIQFTPRPQEKIISKFQALNYQNQFGYSYNLMLFLNVFIYLIAIVLFLASLATSKSTTRKFKEAAIFFPRQIGFGLVIFSTLNITVALGLQIISLEIISFENIWSKILLGCTMIIITVHLTIFFATNHGSIDTFSFYKRSNFLTKFHPILLMLRNNFLGIGLILAIIWKQAMYGLLSIQGIYLILVIGIRPYKRIVDLIRAIVIEIIILFILTSRFMQSQYLNINDSTSEDYLSFGYLNPYIQFGGLILCQILCVISFVYHIYRVVKDKKIYPNMEQLNEQANPRYDQQSLSEQLNPEELAKLQKRQTITFEQLGNTDLYLQEASTFGDRSRKVNRKQRKRRKNR